jgi:hypothetical protein
MSSDLCLPIKTTPFSTATTAGLCVSWPSTLQPLQAFQRERVHDTIVFFGSARLREDGPLGRYYAEARELKKVSAKDFRALKIEKDDFLATGTTSSDRARRRDEPTDSTIRGPNPNTNGGALLIGRSTTLIRS